MTHSDQNHTFNYAIVASLVLHASVLLLFPDLLDPARRGVTFPPPLIARLMDPEPAPAPALAPPERPAATPPAEMPIARLPAKPVPQVPKPASESPSPPAPQAAVEPAPPLEAPPTPAPAIAALEPQPPASAPQPAEPPESLSRDQYRIELIGAAKRIKDEMRYPPLARENNWEGGVLVAVVIAANGRPAIAVKGSSGYEVLDRHALEIFRRATRAVPVPPPLRGKEFALEVHAIFNLEN